MLLSGEADSRHPEGMKQLALAALALLLSTTASANRLGAVIKPVQPPSAWATPMGAVLSGVAPGVRPGLPALAAIGDRPISLIVQAPLLFQLEKAGWTAESFAALSVPDAKMAAAIASDAARAELAQFVKRAEDALTQDANGHLDRRGSIDQARADHQRVHDLARDLSEIRVRYSAYFNEEGRAHLDQVIGLSRRVSGMAAMSVVARVFAVSRRLGVSPDELHATLDHAVYEDAGLTAVAGTNLEAVMERPTRFARDIPTSLAAFSGDAPAAVSQPAVERPLAVAAQRASASEPVDTVFLPTAMGRVYASLAAVMALASGALLAVPAFAPVGAAGILVAVSTAVFAAWKGALGARVYTAVAVVLAASAGVLFETPGLGMLGLLLSALAAYALAKLSLKPGLVGGILRTAPSDAMGWTAAGSLLGGLAAAGIAFADGAPWWMALMLGVGVGASVASGLFVALAVKDALSGVGDMILRVSVPDRRVIDAVITVAASALLSMVSSGLVVQAGLWPVGAIGLFAALAPLVWAVWAYETGRPLAYFLRMQLTILAFTASLAMDLPIGAAIFMAGMTAIAVQVLPQRRY